MRFAALVLAAVTGAWIGAPLAHAQQPVKIRIAWVVPVANSPTILYEKPSILKHKGKSYEVELVRFQGTPPMITALAAKEVDIALFAYSSFALAVQNANMQDLRVIADEAQEGVDGTSPRRTRSSRMPRSIRSRTSRVRFGLRRRRGCRRYRHAGDAQDEQGLEDKRDYSVVEAGFPNMRAMLAEKKADLISASCRCR